MHKSFIKMATENQQPSKPDSVVIEIESIDEPEEGYESGGTGEVPSDGEESSEYGSCQSDLPEKYKHEKVVKILLAAAKSYREAAYEEYKIKDFGAAHLLFLIARSKLFECK